MKSELFEDLAEKYKANRTERAIDFIQIFVTAVALSYFVTRYIIYVTN